MNKPTTSDWQPEVVETLRALGGEGTLGDLVAITGLFRWEVEAALQALMSSEQAHVSVSESGDVVYHLAGRSPVRARPRWLPRGVLAGWWARSPRSARVAFDRKTLRLLRTREGVISLAELVEHTGLPLGEARVEMARLVESYGGVPHPSWDGHIVYAFPELMSSTHGRFESREPRPAWVRSDDPMEVARAGRFGLDAALPLNSVGFAASLGVPWIALGALGAAGSPGYTVGAALVSAAGGLFFGSRVLRAIAGHRRFRFRSRKALRRYALGHVIQTALAGKGVVSLERTVAYLQARAGRKKVSRSAVEGALRQLAEEFDAPITEVNGELFFGFRNVKRQFLASHVVRRRIRLGRMPEGRTVFDSSDPPLLAGVRDLESFDRELYATRRDTEKNHDEAWVED